MPFFKNSPPGRSIMIEQGWPIYLLGSRQSIDGEMRVTSVALTSNVAVVSVTGWSGPLPVVGAFISIDKTQTNSGIFNVTNLPITAVTVDQTGTGTISFALTHADVVTATDIGNVHIRFAAIGEAFTTAGGASIAGSVGNVVGRNGNFIAAVISFPTGTPPATVALQGSNTNNDADFLDIATLNIANGKGGASVETSLEFLRYNIPTGTSGTVVGSINA